MLTIETKLQVEKDFKEIVDKNYNGDTTKALMSFIEHERAKELTWDEKFQFHLNHLRQKVKKLGDTADDKKEMAIKENR